MSGSNGKRRFPDIGMLGFLSNRSASALLAGGDIAWHELEMGGEAVFSSLLGARDVFRLRPVKANRPTKQGYVDGTLVSQTVWRSAFGEAVVFDALVTREDGAPSDVLIRFVECTNGTVNMELRVEPGFGFGRHAARWRKPLESEAGLGADVLVARNGDEGRTLRLSTDFDREVDGGAVTATRTLSKGGRAFVALSWGDESPPCDVEDAHLLLKETLQWWQTWSEALEVDDHEYRPGMIRSLTVLEGLRYKPTGAIMAAGSTSLPEDLGGVRNWDYRYCWVRDAVMTALALKKYGKPEAADELLEFFMARAAEAPLQIMYGVRGELELREQELELPGYEHSFPVRTGNGAARQKQHDMTAYLMRLVAEVTKDVERPDLALWGLVLQCVELALENQNSPDHGIWEARGTLQFFLTSQLGVWETLSTAAGLAHKWGFEHHALIWGKKAKEHGDWILKRGVRGGVFMAAIDPDGIPADALDASVLMVPLVGFLPPDDERVRNTLLAVVKGLGRSGLVDRYDPEVYDDGLPGGEGSFLLTTFWADALFAQIGERALSPRWYKMAVDRFDQVLRRVKGYGLLSEEFDLRHGRWVGNTPQAFSHIGFLLTASAIDKARKELTREGLL